MSIERGVFCVLGVDVDGVGGGIWLGTLTHHIPVQSNTPAGYPPRRRRDIDGASEDDGWGTNNGCYYYVRSNVTNLYHHYNCLTHHSSTAWSAPHPVRRHEASLDSYSIASTGSPIPISSICWTCLRVTLSGTLIMGRSSLVTRWCTRKQRRRLQWNERDLILLVVIPLDFVASCSCSHSILYLAYLS